MKPGEEPPTYSITTAAQARSAEMNARMVRYLIQMGLRLVCLILIFVVHGPVRWVFAALAIILPYVAVVMANTVRHRRGSGGTGVIRTEDAPLAGTDRLIGGSE